jgi:hypothetical protein
LGSGVHFKKDFMQNILSKRGWFNPYTFISKSFKDQQAEDYLWTHIDKTSLMRMCILQEELKGDKN